MLDLTRSRAVLRGVPAAIATAMSLAAALALGAFAAGPARADDSSQHSIRQDEPETGTRLRRVTGTSALPLDRSYHELTPEQQAQVRARYEQMGEGDEPPYPLRGFGALMRPLVQAQQKIGDDGLLVLFVDIDANGDATKVEVMQTPSSQIARIAAAIAMETKFKPALCRGQPCAMGFPWRIRLGRKL